MKYPREWFRARIGKTVYRKHLKEYGFVCACPVCTATAVAIADFTGDKTVKNPYFHADYLFLNQQELGIEYQDKNLKEAGKMDREATIKGGTP